MILYMSIGAILLFVNVFTRHWLVAAVAVFAFTGAIAGNQLEDWTYLQWVIMALWLMAFWTAFKYGTENL